MNENISPDLEKNEPDQPLSFKATRLIERKFKALDRFEKINGKSAETLLERGKIHLEKNAPAVALDFFKKSLELRKNLECIHKLAICYGKLDKNEDAAELFEKHLKDFEWSGAYWVLLAFYKKMVGDFETAFGASYTAIKKFDQSSPATWRIISACAAETQRWKQLYDVSKRYIDKGSNYTSDLIEAYLNSCLQLEEKYPDEAINFLETTSFNWRDYSLATGMAASLYNLKGDLKTSLRLNERALELSPNDISIKWNLSLAQLRTGRFIEGFKNYEIRWLWPDFPSPRRTFEKPNFNTISEKDLETNTYKNSKVMVWYEQGIGDQLRFFSALPKFAEEFPNLIIEPSRKTEVLLNNTFPNIPTRVDNFNAETLHALKEDFDFHMPLGDMFFYVMKKYGDQLLDKNFSVMEGYLVADKLRSLYWRDKLNALSQKPKIGFCWRSGIIDKKRSSYYTNLKQWEKLFKNPNFSFVNLQYDLSHDELLDKHPEVREYFLDTGFLDQRDDLEGAQALISNLDFVISPSSTPGMIASASGIPAVIYHKPNIWSFGRHGKFVKNPIYKNSRSYHTINIRDNEELINDISEYVINFFGKN